MPIQIEARYLSGNDIGKKIFIDNPTFGKVAGELANFEVQTRPGNRIAVYVHVNDSKPHGRDIALEGHEVITLDGNMKPADPMHGKD